jgi:hypothetical protein
MGYASLVAIVLFAQGQQVVPPPSKVVATVDGTPIRASEVEKSLWDWYGPSVTEELILNRQIAHYADAHGVHLTEAEIQQAYNAQAARVGQNLKPGESVDEALRATGVAPSRLRSRVKSDLLLSKLAEKQFKQADFVKIQTLIVKPKTDSAADVATAIQRAQAAYDRVSKGENWEAVLNATTDDPRLRNNGGEIGWKLFTAFPAQTREELKSLKEGGVTKPVQTAYGIQMFRIEAQGRDLKGADLDSLRQQFVAADKGRILDDIRAHSKVVR